MAVRLDHYVLTLNGNAQQIASSAGVYLREISVQPAAGNSNPVYIGTDANLTSSDYGVRIPAPVDGIPPAPFILGEFEDGSVQLSDLWFLGTNAEKVHVLVVRHNVSRRAS